MKLFSLLKLLLQKLCVSQNAVNYLCGNEALPQPLTVEEEAECFAKMHAGDNFARDKLVEHNLRLVVFLAKKFESTNLDMEDLISVGTIGLIKAINSFKAEKQIKLATYASRCIENAILSQMRLWFRINPPRAKKNTNGVFWHRFPRIFTSFAPLRTAM